MKDLSPGALNLETTAARLFLADSARPGIGPFSSLDEANRRRYLAMAQVAQDVHREAVDGLCVEIDRNASAPSACQVSKRGVVIFDGVSRDALLRR